MIGEFESPDKTPYVLIVNKSLTKSQAIEVIFKKTGTIYQVNNYTGAAEPWTGEKKWMAPGQGMILFLKE